SATNTVNVSVLTPTASASNTGPYCVNGTIQLNTPAATSYTWSGPAAFASNLQNPTRSLATTGMSGTYTVIVAIGTCTASATTSVTVNALPTPTAGSNSPVCVGQPINLSGSAATSFTWSGPAAFASNLQNPTIATAGTANAGVYTYSVSDANGCKNSITTNVVVNTLPVVTVNNPTVCVNQSINLTSSGGTSYSWSGPNSYSSASQNPTIPTAASNMTGAYTVTVTSAAGCKNTAVANVSVVALPVINVATGGPVCLGSTLLFTSNGGTSYSWSGPGGFSSNQQNPSLTNSTMGMNGLYTVIVTANTCSASATIGGTVNALPTPIINSNSPVCVGQPINFTGNGGTVYTWSGPGGFTATGSTPSIPVSSMSNNGSYSLTVTDANGCVGSTNALVIVSPTPTALATGTSACQNANASIGASGGVSYSWSGPGGFTSSAQNPTLLNVTTASAGQYTVVVSSAAGCSNTAVANVVVNPAPTPSIVVNSPVCINSILSMSGTGGVSYSWSGPNGFFSASQSPTVIANTTAFTGNYNLTVVDINGCSGTAMASATINPTPNVFVTASNDKGCAPLCVTFTATSTSSIQAYSWNMGDGSSSVGPNAMSCYSAPGVFTANVSVQDMNGCFNAATHTVQIYQQPVADFNYSPIKPIENVDVVEFTDASYTGTITSWSWYFMSNAQYTSSQQNPTFIYTDAGQYAIALVVKNTQGCSDTVVKSIVVGEDFGIWVPNAFTPNGDGLNDVFYAKGYGVTKFSLEIYDRWGEKVFTSSDINSAWDGTYMSRGAGTIQEGVYTWMVKVTSVAGKAKELTGHVTLIK
ncbi:MAG: PKD domain-containing protein, partial [Bacteroidia bacterium]